MEFLLIQVAPESFQYSLFTVLDAFNKNQTSPLLYELLQEFSYPIYFSCRCYLFHIMAFVVFIDCVIWGLLHIFP